MMRTIRFLFSLAGSFVALTLGSLSAAEDNLPEVQKHLREKQALLVDVREQSEWNQGHVSEAVLVPLSAMRDRSKLDELTASIPKDRILYTYCRSGKRSFLAVDYLKELGYDVRPLTTGFKGLVDTGFKAEKP